MSENEKTLGDTGKRGRVWQNKNKERSLSRERSSEVNTDFGT